MRDGARCAGVRIDQVVRATGRRRCATTAARTRRSRRPARLPSRTLAIGRAGAAEAASRRRPRGRRAPRPGRRRHRRAPTGRRSARSEPRRPAGHPALGDPAQVEHACPPGSVTRGVAAVDRRWCRAPRAGRARCGRTAGWSSRLRRSPRPPASHPISGWNTPSGAAAPSSRMPRADRASRRDTATGAAGRGVDAADVAVATEPRPASLVRRHRGGDGSRRRLVDAAAVVDPPGGAGGRPLPGRRSWCTRRVAISLCGWSGPRRLHGRRRRGAATDTPLIGGTS